MLTGMTQQMQGGDQVQESAASDEGDDAAITTAFATSWAQGIQVWASALGGRSQRSDALVATTLDRPAFILNAVVLLRPLEPASVADTLAGLDDFFGFTRGVHTGRVLLFSTWDTPDLESHGWSNPRRPPLMHRPAGGAAPEPPAGFRAERVTDPAALRAAEKATVSSFDQTAPELQEPGGLFSTALLQEPRMPIWVGKEGDQVVSTAATFVADDVNNIVNVATVPEARRRGYGAAVTWPATFADPALPTVLGASKLGAPVYEQMGFRTVRHLTVWSRTSDHPS